MNHVTAVCLVALAAEQVLVTADLLQAIGAGKGLREKVAKRQSEMLEQVFLTVEDTVIDREYPDLTPIGWDRVVRKVDRARDLLYQARKSADFDFDDYLKHRGER